MAKNAEPAPAKEEKPFVPTVETPADPMRQFVTVVLPRATGKEEDFLFVGLNGKGYTIKRGIPVRVPRPVADIVYESERQRERQLKFEDEQTERARRGQG